MTSAPKKRFVVKAPDRSEDLAHKGSAERQTLRHEIVLQNPRPKLIFIQQPLKDHSKSDFNLGQVPYEFCKPRKRLLRILDHKVRNVRKRRYYSAEPRPPESWIAPDPTAKPPDDHTTGDAPVEGGMVVCILTRPWDPGTKSPLIVTAEPDQVQPLTQEVVQNSDDEVNHHRVHSESCPQTEVRIRKHTQNQINRVHSVVGSIPNFAKLTTIPKYQPLLQAAAKAPDKREFLFSSHEKPADQGTRPHPIARERSHPFALLVLLEDGFRRDGTPRSRNQPGRYQLPSERRHTGWHPTDDGAEGEPAVRPLPVHRKHALARIKHENADKFNVSNVERTQRGEHVPFHGRRAPIFATETDAAHDPQRRCR